MKKALHFGPVGLEACEGVKEVCAGRLGQPVTHGAWSSFVSRASMKAPGRGILALRGKEVSRAAEQWQRQKVQVGTRGHSRAACHPPSLKAAAVTGPNRLQLRGKQFWK